MIGLSFISLRRGAALVSLATVALLAGCVVVPARDYYARDDYYDSDVVNVEPPPPRAEIIGVAPIPGQIWLGGYWGWSGGRHVWTGGRWAAPRPGYYWQPHLWVRAGGGWRLGGGRWGRR